jgi:hypothetical protein
VPHKWSYNQQGDLVIAKNPFIKKRIVELPSELVQALESSFFGIRESAVNELGRYLQSREPEMVDLAIFSLEKMKGDDSRRISSLAERLLLEFQQTRVPNPTMTSSITSLQIEPETAIESSESSIPSPKLTTEIGPAAGKSLSEVEKVSKSIGTSLTSSKLLFNSSFWFKWIGISVLGLIFLSIIFDYDGTIISSGSYPFPGSYVVLILFSIVAASLSFVQWFIFRDRLEDWWITANAATAIVLGLIHRSLYYANNWWDHGYLRIPFAVWLIGNFALGAIIMRKAHKGLDFSSPLSTKPAAKFAETGTRQNIFFILLSFALVLFALFAFSTAVGLTGSDGVVWIFLGIADILVGISFVLKKEIPRNIGFITLATSLFLDGIIIELIAFNSDYFSQSLFVYPGLISLSSGIFFAFQRETRKNFGFILLSGYLISLSLAQITANQSSLEDIFFNIAALLALPAAFFLFRGQ